MTRRRRKNTHGPALRDKLWGSAGPRKILREIPENRYIDSWHRTTRWDQNQFCLINVISISKFDGIYWHALNTQRHTLRQECLSFVSVNWVCSSEFHAICPLAGSRSIFRRHWYAEHNITPLRWICKCSGTQGTQARFIRLSKKKLRNVLFHSSHFRFGFRCCCCWC